MARVIKARIPSCRPYARASLAVVENTQPAVATPMFGRHVGRPPPHVVSARGEVEG